MTMAPRSGQVLDQNNVPVLGAKVYVYDLLGNLAALTSNGTTSILNPLTTDEFGTYSYQAAVAYYNEDIWFGGQRRWRTENVAIGSPGADLALRTDLAASGGSALVDYLPAGANGVPRTVQAKLREGLTSAADYSVLPTPTDPERWYIDYGDSDGAGPLQYKISIPNTVNMSGGGNVEGVGVIMSGSTSAATPNSGIAETECIRLVYSVNAAAGHNLVPYLINGTLTSSHNIGVGNTVESGAILVTNRVEGPTAGGSSWAIGVWGADLHVEKMAGVAPGKMVGLEVGVHSDVTQTYGDATQRMNGIELWSGPRDVDITGVRAHDALKIFGASGWTTFLNITDTDGSQITKLDQAGNFTTKGAIGRVAGVGAGGSITQLTSKSTAVPLNKVCGQITLNNAALAANTIVSFPFTNTQIGADDEVRVWIKSGNATTGTYRVQAEGIGSGGCTIVLENKTGGSLSEALVLGFNVIKCVIS